MVTPEALTLIQTSFTFILVIFCFLSRSSMSSHCDRPPVETGKRQCGVSWQWNCKCHVQQRLCRMRVSLTVPLNAFTSQKFKETSTQRDRSASVGSVKPLERRPAIKKCHSKPPAESNTTPSGEKLGWFYGKKKKKKNHPPSFCGNGNGETGSVGVGLGRNNSWD